MTPNERLVAIVSAMAIHYAIVARRGSELVAGLVDEACRTEPLPGTELDTAIAMLDRERRDDRGLIER